MSKKTSQAQTVPISSSALDPTAEGDVFLPQQATKFNVPVSQEVMEMQKQLIGLYNDFKKYPEFSQTEFETPWDPSRKELMGQGANAFLQFLLLQYANQSSIQGAQIDPKDTNYIQKGWLLSTSQPRFSFRKLIDSLGAVGKHTKEGLYQPDGIWMQYTDNALKNTYAFARAFVYLSDNLKLSLSFYNKNDLDELEYNIAPSYTDVKSIPQRARAITENLKKARAALPEFHQQMLSLQQSQGLGALSQNKKPFSIGLNGHPTSVVPKPEEAIYFKQIISNDAVAAEKVPNSDLTFGDLKSLQDFKNFLMRHNVVVNGQEVWADSKLLKEEIARIKQHLQESQ